MAGPAFEFLIATRGRASERTERRHREPGWSDLGPSDWSPRGEGSSTDVRGVRSPPLQILGEGASHHDPELHAQSDEADQGPVQPWPTVLDMDAFLLDRHRNCGYLHERATACPDCGYFVFHTKAESSAKTTAALPIQIHIDAPLSPIPLTP